MNDVVIGNNAVVALGETYTVASNSDAYCGFDDQMRPPGHELHEGDYYRTNGATVQEFWGNAWRDMRVTDSNYNQEKYETNAWYRFGTQVRAETFGETISKDNVWRDMEGREHSLQENRLLVDLAMSGETIPYGALDGSYTFSNSELHYGNNPVLELVYNIVNYYIEGIKHPVKYWYRVLDLVTFFVPSTWIARGIMWTFKVYDYIKATKAGQLIEKTATRVAETIVKAGRPIYTAVAFVHREISLQIYTIQELFRQRMLPTPLNRGIARMLAENRYDFKVLTHEGMSTEDRLISFTNYIRNVYTYESVFTTTDQMVYQKSTNLFDMGTNTSALNDVEVPCASYGDEEDVLEYIESLTADDSVV